MRNKALWFRYFQERSGPKRPSLGRRFAAPPAVENHPHEWFRMNRPSLRGLRKAGGGP